MNELIDKFLLELFEGINDKLTVLMGEFITDSQALAAAFMLMYFGLESFKMMSGDKKLQKNKPYRWLQEVLNELLAANESFSVSR